MLRNVLLLTKKNLLGRYGWFTILIFAFILFIFPFLLKQDWNDYSPCFLPLCYIGFVCAFNTVYGDANTVFGFRFKTTGLTGVLPVTRWEVIVSRYAVTFIVIVAASAVWGLLSLVESLYRFGIFKVYAASATLLVLSAISAILASNTLLIFSSLIHNSTGIYILCFVFFMFFTFAQSIAVYVFSQIELALIWLLLLAITGMIITIAAAVFNHSLIRKLAV